MNLSHKQRQWNEVYSKFQGKRSSVWREEATPFFTRKIDYLKHNKVVKVLDAGCGDGRNLLAFVKTGFKVTGVDISDVALKKCRKILGANKDIILKRDSLENLNFNSNTFDAIICDFVLVHIENIKRVISNFYRVLKPKGFVLLEFISTKDARCNKGKIVGKNQYIQHGVFIRTFDIKDIEHYLKNFKILFMDSEYYSDPEHGIGYHRSKRHTHHSYFVIAQKD